MSDLTATLKAVLGNETQVGLDRAAGELRAARPLIIAAPGRMTLVAALDGASPSLFSAMAALEGGVLALSAQRARVLGLTVDAAVAIPLNGLDQAAALRLATEVRPEKPSAWSPASAEAAAAIDLCKEGLLLPAALAAPLTAATALPAGLHRIVLPIAPSHETAQPHPLEVVAQAEVPLDGGVKARFMVFRGGPAPRDQVAIIVGDPDPSRPVMVRAHSACLTGDLFGSLRCDCGDQLRTAVSRLSEEGGGVLLYLDQEGRGIGIGNKMRAYALQDEGFDTIDADAILGFGADERRYEYAAAILHALGYLRINLLTNNPEKIGALTRGGIEVVSRQSLYGDITPQNRAYLQTKQARASHMLEELLKVAKS